MAEVPADVAAAALAALEGKQINSKELPAVLLTQAKKARQLGVSRHTVRKLAELGKLHPIELLPGLIRYRSEELI